MLSSVFFTILGAALVAATPSTLEGYTFKQFVKEHNLKFDRMEMPERELMFNVELARVKEHNAKNLSWKEGMNKFSVMTADEKKAFMGRHKGAARNQDKMLKNAHSLPADFNMKSVSALPRHVDWRSQGVVSAVKDQGHCGSCWAFASTAVIESHVALASGLLFDLSTEQMAMCAPNPDSCGGTGGCEGSTAELAFEYVTGSKGLLSEFQYSYTSYYGEDESCAIPSGQAAAATIDGYVQLPENDYSSLMTAIATVGPVAISVDASAWSAYEGGIFDGCNQAQPDIDHAVTLMGYGEEKDGSKYWLVRNSWSPAWGEKGYIKIARTDDEEQRCGTDTTPQDGTACAGDDEPKEVCGTCGILYDSAYPLNAAAL
eukprot:CAMPEP_0181289130 /NCGR_PEP_ID=MMETSP1101-20121128/718_1 /TAXON_ID=46948 /ORGANISM="Rhodomonas abbreviata, Strain Caron Lab Isolate" /LENGTH=372 /DNA_ID=CAMNT_0023393331 /DNA_START=106 /DNA_END=1224 /DNA_ORIENTATION=+